MRRLACFSLHAEKMHDDSVWRMVEQLATAAARRSQRLTFFVHPFWAIAAGVDIGDRVRRLAELGHEIAQHTHYYQPAIGLTPIRKVDDLAPDKVRQRLEEDYATLCRSGITPKGFVSGAWTLPDLLPGWLAERGFAYDCTFRTYALSYRNDAALVGDLAAGPFVLEGRVLEVPTTAPLRAALLGVLRIRPPSVTAGDSEYQLVYLHDEDLLDARKRLAVRMISRALGLRGWRWVSAGELAEEIRCNVERVPR